jgi:phenylacetate-CoA ligase
MSGAHVDPFRPTNFWPHTEIKMNVIDTQQFVSTLPTYHHSIDWDALYKRYPVPDVFANTRWKWSADQTRAFQNEQFLDLMNTGWQNGFYQHRWKAAGIEPGDIRSIDDITKLPTFDSDDIKKDQQDNPPFGLINGPVRERLKSMPTKVQTSGGTTGKPRPTMYGPIEWEMNGLTMARVLYICGLRPGDVIQIPHTCSLGNAGWCCYKAAHDYLGALPLTTGTGVVTSSRRQIEIAQEWGTNVWYVRPEYSTQLAKVARDELKFDLRDLKTKFLGCGLGPDTDGAFAKQIEDLWGCPVYDMYGTHEMGMGSFECPARNGMHFMEDCTFFEVVDTETEAPVPNGTIGNMVCTILHRRVMPMIRFNLRDLTKIIATDRCSCGSCFRRMEKMLGRSDTMVRIRGVSIWPQACLPAIKSDPRTTGEWLCIAERHERDGVVRDEMTLKVEVRDDAGGWDGLKEHIEKRLHSDLGLKLAVELVSEDALIEYSNRGREGKPKRIIDRRYEKK